MDQTGFRYTFTVFTPTFNRAHTLGRVYDALKAQTFRDFEWLIVDDGSTDDTALLVKRWQSEKLLLIRYIQQPNQGKHIAMNRGTSEADGRFFLTIDSDDSCAPEALEKFLYHWNQIPEPVRDKYSAVTALCVDQAGHLIGTRYPVCPLDSDSIEVRYKYRVTGDKWGFQRTEIMREFPFPAVSGEPFVTEDIIWRAIARKYRTRYVNEPLLVVFRDILGTAHLSHTTMVSQAEGRRLYNRSVLNEDIKWLPTAPYDFFRIAANFSRCSFLKDIGVFQQCNELTNWPARILWLVALPVGHLLSWRDRR